MGVRERLDGSVWTWSSASLLAAASPASQPMTQPCREPFTIARPCTSAPATTSFHQSSFFDGRCHLLLSICADGAGWVRS